MYSANKIVRSEVKETIFNLYTDNEKLTSLSCCKIDQPFALDSNGKAIPRGLYDEKMGPIDHTGVCHTCKLKYAACSGHPGHIDLNVPVYYPVLFASMYQLLKSKCFYCHKMRMSVERVRYYLVKLKLLEMGDIENATNLEDLLQASTNIFSEDDQEIKKNKINSIDYEQYFRLYEERYEIYIRNNRNKTYQQEDGYNKDLQNQVIDLFQRTCVSIKSCENCNAITPPLRNDQYTKIFQKPMPKRLRKTMALKKLKFKTAVDTLKELGLSSYDEDLLKTTRINTSNISELLQNHYVNNSDNDDSDHEYSDEDEVDINNDSVDEDNEGEDGNDMFTDVDRYLIPIEVEAQLRLLWRNHQEILDFIWLRAINTTSTTTNTTMNRSSSILKGNQNYTTKKQLQQQKDSEGWKIFFTRVIVVPPNKFRPAGKIGDIIAEHPQNIHLKKVLQANIAIYELYHPNNDVDNTTNIINSTKKTLKSSLLRNSIQAMNNKITSNNNDNINNETNYPSVDLSKVVSRWIELQNSVNCYIDSAKDSNILTKGQAGPAGIRQILERKEGLFRKHMMGKRVNFCCRSVISPDPYIGTNEIGIPKHFAMALHYPTPVNDWNVKHLRILVQRGPNQYPGANQIELADGKIIKLDSLSDMERAAKAKLLQSSPGIKVHRHLIDGDVLLVNRQPTLHKPGIMAHKARVLRHMKEQTLRMHYANCNTYNADFDGDEMNCHFVQSELARAEANYICNTDNQYIGPTSGNPLRGLIQDHVASAVKLTCKNTFLTKIQFQQLVYIAVSGLPGTEIVTATDIITLPQPTILKPQYLWTGKQVITALLSHLCRPPLPPLHLDAKAKTPAVAFGEDNLEHEVIFRFGELLCGVLDKGAIGSTSLGIVHTVYELYGPEFAGSLLSAFGKLFTFYLQTAGQTCGIEDLILTKQADKERKRLLKKVAYDSEVGLAKFMEVEIKEYNHNNYTTSNHQLSNKEQKELETHVAKFLNKDRVNNKIKLDGKMQSIINQSASDVIKACIPSGLEATFQKNNFSLMVLTGAKGSSVNQSQISCFLGQQALEGQRVPLMISGKSLPSFRPYEASARAGGFVQDRFLTGVKPQEYYFHCMAGREGLVDTAVKTSRSGYLQRCLVKHLEELKVQYDMTVRDSAGNIVQFLYGEDGLDPVAASLLKGDDNQMRFLARNNQAFVAKHSLRPDFFNQGVEVDTASVYQKQVSDAKKLLLLSGNKENLTHISVGSVIQARKKKAPELDWERTNLCNQWYTAIVIKLRESSHQKNGRSISKYDIQYTDDHSIEKKVPGIIMVHPRLSSGGGPVPRIGFNTLDPNLSWDHKLPVYLIKPGIPDPAMNKLRLDRCVGAISEKLQENINDYVTKNDDGVITNSVSCNTINPDALQLLVWVKYLRSFACPGEAVGCIAAQSVGEPSTQMTLNTFHLAGHGGANVTLGIPRLREIIMTASRKLKTPTMFVPMKNLKDITNAKGLARKLSRLPLTQLLNHKSGIEVGEEIKKSLINNKWERIYRIRLSFEDYKRIETAFGISFDVIIGAIKTIFTTKLDRLIKLEQRRAGDSTSGGVNQAMKGMIKGEINTSFSENIEDITNYDSDNIINDNKHQTKTTTNTSASSSKNKKHSNHHTNNNNSTTNTIDGIDGEDNMIISTSHRKNKQQHDVHSENGSDSESDNGEGDNDIGNLKLSGNKKEIDGYDDNDSDNSNYNDKEIDINTKEISDSEIEEDEANNNSTTRKDNNRASKNKKQVKSTATTTSTTSFRKDKFHFSERESWVEVELAFPTRTRRLLMTQLAEIACTLTMVRATKNLSNAYAVEEDKAWGVVTEGVNFEALWLQDDGLINNNEIKSNDIWQILCTYGVEAARHSIVSEIKNVFGVYGINVDPRHLSLIADFMTRHGSFTPLNRSGMLSCPSPFLRMSFESTCSFLTKAAQEGQIDNLQSPSARIVLGGTTKVGTGCFDLMLPLNL